MPVGPFLEVWTWFTEDRLSDKGCMNLPDCHSGMECPQDIQHTKAAQIGNFEKQCSPHTHTPQHSWSVLPTSHALQLGVNLLGGLY